MTFSGTLRLTDLNDFITPSQACIKPVEQSNVPEPVETGAPSTEIRIDASGSYYEVSGPEVGTVSMTAKQPVTQKLEQAQISLNDCLACSGCITSAESVLITLQSHTEVFTFLDSNPRPDSPSHKVPVISIAPQSLASLAASLTHHLNIIRQSDKSTESTTITPRQVLCRVRAFCTKSLGFTHVFDTTFGRHIALQEHIKEFLERQEADSQQKQGSSSGHVEYRHQLPMLASACPGWVCYAEKAHPEMLPFIARTKSPQQVMGTLVKEWVGEKLGKNPNEVYHVSVMPCYDKKLEASRQDFYNDIYSTRDVDCVITTGELEMMMQEKGWDLTKPIPGETDPIHSDWQDVTLPELVQHPGSSSGSYLHSLIVYLQSTSSVPLSLSVKMVRNTDFEEHTLRENNTATGRLGKVVFKGAKCYGFRNLQNVVRKVGRERNVRVANGAAGRLIMSPASPIPGGRVKGGIAKRVASRKKSINAEGANYAGKEEEEEDRLYDYVEVMACPGGCVNGGGQLRPPALPTKSLENVGLDEEGYGRNWEDSGVSITSSSTSIASTMPTPNLNPKWGDKEWTKKVEEMYWQDVESLPEGNLASQAASRAHESSTAGPVQLAGNPYSADLQITSSIDLPSFGILPSNANGERLNGFVLPLSSCSETSSLVQPQLHYSGRPTKQNGHNSDYTGDHYAANSGGENKLVVDGKRIDNGGAAEAEKSGSGVITKAGANYSTLTWPERARKADELVQRVLEELAQQTGEGDLRKLRERLFRTKYRAVESDVVGIAIQW